MHLFSTIFFVEGNPVKYEVRLAESTYLLYPSDNPDNFIDPPILSVVKKEGLWEVAGTTDRDLIDQVIEDLELNEERHTSS
ncbi:MAG: hypothetical protein JWP88_438 [Flaviaesturariibacter sp.]|nr:hypothetical protein [Flaviaesturariibacter sp.]